MQQSCTYQVCVIQFAYHSKILVPTQTQVFDWCNHLDLHDATTIPSAPAYLSFGWGERNWYVNPPTQLPQKLYGGLRALFLPNAAALRVQKHTSFPQHYQPECVGVSPENYLSLMEFIQNSFQRDSQGKTIQLASDDRTQSSFYEAKGTYFLLNNSNHWTARGLDNAEINTPVWAGHSDTIMFHLVDTC